MKFDFDKIKMVEFELSSHCNAACPQCPRNLYGGATSPDLPLQSWNIDLFKQHIPKKLLRNIDLLYFCGTYGDPLACKDVVKIAKYAREVAPNLRIGIHTNGGLRSGSVYAELAKYLTYMAFGLDGLEDTNHIYRRHVRWSKVMQNSAAYIQAGGVAHWDFIVFEHNEHQVEHARKLSKQLGFSEFNFKRTSRFLNKSHQVVDSLDVQDFAGNYQYTIAPPKNTQYLNTSVDKWRDVDVEQFARTTTINCYACKSGIISIGSEGTVNPCGWLYDRLYGYESSQTQDRQRMLDLMDSVGRHKTNVFKTPLQQIVNGAWFTAIADSWTNDTRINRCGVQCGAINTLSEQNLEVDYIGI